jgi:enterochelin esterase-like enzyme
VTYPSSASVTPAGENYLAVYTPPGYNPRRPTPYPTLYLSHGGGGNEVDWSTQGDLSNIMNNLIDTGQIQPMVVVMPNAYTYADVTNYAGYDENLVNSVIPYVQAHYDVSSLASERAFAGLSMGGAIANSLLFDYTSEFGYFGVMSPGFQGSPPYGNGHFNVPPASSIGPTEAAALKNTGIFVGGGWQDPIHYVATSEVTTLTAVGAAVHPDFINGGHEWYAWRILLRDFLTRVAFFPPAG